MPQTLRPIFAQSSGAGLLHVVQILCNRLMDQIYIFYIDPLSSRYNDLSCQ